MPNPKAIVMPNLDFSEVQIAVLHIMMNKSDKDYSTVNELTEVDELWANRAFARDFGYTV